MYKSVGGIEWTKADTTYVCAHKYQCMYGCVYVYIYTHMSNVCVYIYICMYTQYVYVYIRTDAEKKRERELLLVYLSPLHSPKFPQTINPTI